LSLDTTRVCVYSKGMTETAGQPARTTVYICTTPVQNGQMHCPYCGLTSDDFEKFAIGMCWECMFADF